MEFEFTKQLLRTQLEIQEQTLKNISQEIHDNIGQVLSLVKLNINTMDQQKPDALQEKIADSKILVSKAIQDLRDLSRSLDTDQIGHIGLLRAIETELELLRKTGIHTSIQAEGKPYRLDQQKELILFRIVQEILNNIMKHAKASVIETMILFETSKLQLTITDNGQGFDCTPLSEEGNTKFGLGIRNMHNRALLIGAGFSIQSTPGTGTIVTITLPLIIKPE